MSTADSQRSTGSPPVLALIADDELAAIIRRAAAIDVPAWRVTTALGVSAPAWASGDQLPTESAR